MYILGIETTGVFASVALMKNREIVGYVKGSDRFSHLQNLMPQIETVLEEGGITFKDIEAIAVSCGPGSFTGIRIGVSSARALSQMTRIPCVSVPSLAALAMNAAFIDNKDILICPMMDARRNQIYAGGYFFENGFPVEKIKAGAYMLDEFLSKTERYDRILTLGDAIDVYEEKMKNLRLRGTETASEDIRYQDAVSVVRLGAELYRKNGGITYDKVEPDYMRLAEAERKLREKQRKG